MDQVYINRGNIGSSVYRPGIYNIDRGRGQMHFSLQTRYIQTGGMGYMRLFSLQTRYICKHGDIEAVQFYCSVNRPGTYNWIIDSSVYRPGAEAGIGTQSLRLVSQVQKQLLCFINLVHIDARIQIQPCMDQRRKQVRTQALQFTDRVHKHGGIKNPQSVNGGNVDCVVYRPGTYPMANIGPSIYRPGT